MGLFTTIWPIFAYWMGIKLTSKYIWTNHLSKIKIRDVHMWDKTSKDNNKSNNTTITTLYVFTVEGSLTQNNYFPLEICHVLCSHSPRLTCIHTWKLHCSTCKDEIENPLQYSMFANHHIYVLLLSSVHNIGGWNCPTFIHKLTYHSTIVGSCKNSSQIKNLQKWKIMNPIKRISETIYEKKN